MREIEDEGKIKQLNAREKLKTREKIDFRVADETQLNRGLMTSWIYNCEVQQCEWVTRCLNCCLNHYVEHWIDEYRDSLIKSEAKDELQSELNNLDLIGPKLTHDDLFPYQHAHFFHEAFFELKNAYDGGE